MSTPDTADRIVSLIQSMLPPAADSLPARFRAGPPATGSGVYCPTRAMAIAAANRHNTARAEMIAAGVLTARAPRWTVHPLEGPR